MAQLFVSDRASGIRSWLLKRGAGTIDAPAILGLDEIAVRPSFPLTIEVLVDAPAILGLDEIAVRPSFPRTIEVLVDVVLTQHPADDFALPSPVIDAWGLDLGIPDAELISEAQASWLEDTITTEDIFHPLGRPAADGTIYLKDSSQEMLPGLASDATANTRRPSTRVVASSQRELKTEGPNGLNLFELLLPMLLPPEGAESLEGLQLPEPLYPFQNGGVAFLARNEAALLADAMGLGKTVQAIVALRLLARTGQIRGGLIVCNKAVMPQWKRHLRDWAPELVGFSVEGLRERRRAFWENLTGQAGLRCHVLLATYETIRQDRDLLLDRPFDVIVLDEIQRIKNQDIGITRAIGSLHGKRRWGLSGTPLENRIEDLHSIFGFLKPGLLRGSELSPSLVRKTIEPYLLRRKRDVLDDLPNKNVQDQWLDLTDAQREAYDRAEREGIVELESGQTVTVQHVLALITRLKQICNFEPKTGQSVKADFIAGHLAEVCEGTDKALIFSQYVKSLETLQGRLTEHAPLLYSGQLGDRQRQDVLERFKSDPARRVLLLSLKAGGVGLNLQEANFVFLFDSWWNPAVQWQAIGRVDRIGQKKRVFVRRLLAADTIEERIEAILRRKAALFDETIEGLADVDLRQSFTEEELFGLFGLKPPRIVKQKEADKQWSAIDSGEFERRVANLYEGMGFRTRVTKRSRDGGIDIEAWKQNRTGPERVLIQCKHWPNGTVGEEPIRDLYGVLSSQQDIHRAILVTSGHFSDSARRWAKGKRIELVDGMKLRALVAAASRE